MSEEPVVVGLPLRGEWAAANTPAHRVPSHGTDQLGQRYAYDFIRLGGGGRYYRGSPFQLWTAGLPLAECYGYGRPVLAPFRGRVVEARDGVREKGRLIPLLDLLMVLKNSLAFGSRLEGMSPERLHGLVGNHVIMEGEGAFAFLTHMATGSLAVREGEDVEEGSLLGKVGHSGNSTAPHLHFQLMDRADLLSARGVPCAFREYEAWRQGGWRRVTGGMPARMERVRLQ